MYCHSVSAKPLSRGLELALHKTDGTAFGACVRTSNLPTTEAFEEAADCPPDFSGIIDRAASMKPCFQS
jgi:hypothetical protein